MTNRTASFSIRVVVLAATGIAFMIARGFHSIGETFAVTLAAAVVGHGLALAVRDRPRAAIAVLVGVLAIGIGVDAYIVHARVEPLGPIRYVEAAKLVAAPADFVDRELKVRGTVGPVSRRDRTLAFDLGTAHVRFDGVPPDAFRERAEVVVLGRWTRASDGSYVLDATEISARCPDRYGRP
jgi:cytochrome c-type biogenesis protein CcmE